MTFRVNVGETLTVRLKRTVDGVDTGIQEGLQWTLDHGFPAPCTRTSNADGTISITGVRPGVAQGRCTIGGWKPESQRKTGFGVIVGNPSEEIEVVDAAPAIDSPVAATTYWPGPTLQSR